MLAKHPVQETFDAGCKYLFSPTTFLGLDLRSDAKHIVWVFVDKGNTLATVVVEHDAWDRLGEIMIWTELPDDQFKDMTIDRFVYASKDDIEWTLVNQKSTWQSPLSIMTQAIFQSYLNSIII